jgi:SAM-dependent methyltransferase
MEPDVRQLVRRGYDRAADSYLAARTRVGADVALLDEVIPHLPTAARVLDAGCGGGQPVSEALLDAGVAVSGLDISVRQLHLARSGLGLATVAQGDLAALPFAPGAFDAVVSYYAIFHLPRAEHPTVFAEFRRVLRRRGLALLCLGSRDIPEDRDADSWLGQPMYWSQFDAATNLSLVAAAGFGPVWHRDIADPMGHGRHLFVLARADG